MKSLTKHAAQLRKIRNRLWNFLQAGIGNKRSGRDALRTRDKQRRQLDKIMELFLRTGQDYAAWIVFVNRLCLQKGMPLVFV